MSVRGLAVICVLASISGCNASSSDTDPPIDASESFANAINSRDIESAMAHWSEDAVLYFQSRDEKASMVSREDIRKNYENLFQEEQVPTLKIRVDGLDRVGDTAYEWGEFTIGDSAGCYVLLRRAADSWRIYREWIVDPCE